MKLMEDISNRSVQHVRVIPSNESSGLLRQVYQQMEKEFGIVPPLSVHSKVPRILAALWSATRESLIAGEGRLTKELIATTVSEINECPFCVDVHSVVLRAGGITGDKKEFSESLGSDQQKIRAWTQATRSSGNSLLKNPPFKENEIAPFFATAVTFHYINRVVNVFMKEGSPLNLNGKGGWSRKLMRFLGAKTVGAAMLKMRVKSGESLHLVETLAPATRIPWMIKGGETGLALARFFAITNEEVLAVIPDEPRLQFRDAIASWNGEDTTLGRSWLTEAVAKFPAECRESITLAFLVARSSHQIMDADIDRFRSRHTSDEDLIRVVSWGASVAAERIATWIDPEFKS